jgi:hypothetical protein
MSKLLRKIDAVRRRFNACLEDLTVLSPETDPYRVVRWGVEGRWFRRVFDRFVAESETKHFRGLHYCVVGANDTKRPDGADFVNDEKGWRFLSARAGKAARWLALIGFERITDERNSAPELGYLRPYQAPEISWGLASGSLDYELPAPPSLYLPSLPRLQSLPTLPRLENLLPQFWRHATASQLYKFVLFGEKSSLGGVLRPIARELGTGLLLPDGECSDTLVAEVAKIAAYAATDPRPTAVLYCSDFDPAGNNMPISVARRLQALKDLLYPKLKVEVHHVGLTQEQVLQFNLPPSPIKDTEKRRKKWIAAKGREATEIDALMALHPGALEKIVRNFIKRFRDPTLLERSYELADQKIDEARDQLEEHPEYANKVEQIEQGFEALKQKIDTFEEVRKQAFETLEVTCRPAFEAFEKACRPAFKAFAETCQRASGDVEAAKQDLVAAQEELVALADGSYGTLEPPEPDLPDLPEPLFDSDYDADDLEAWYAATHKLRAYKFMEDGEAGDE